MQYFINSSPWNHDAVLARLRQAVHARKPRGAGALVLGEFHVNKHGRHSAGVGRHLTDWSKKLHSGWRKDSDGPRRADQSEVRWHSRSLGSMRWDRAPVAARLYLPTEWTNDPQRLEQAKVPTEFAQPRDRGDTVIKLLRSVSLELPEFEALLLDAYYGSSLEFLDKLERNEVPYLARISDKLSRQVFYPTRFFPIRSPESRPKRHWWGCGTPYVDWLYNVEQSPERWMPMDQLTANGECESIFAEYMETIPLSQRVRTIAEIGGSSW